MPRLRSALAVLGATLPLLTLACRPAPPPPEGAPRLILYLVVDQMRYDYLERFRSTFTGGLARLMEEGVSFTQTHHEHAVTTTGPGHAALATGLYPRHNGIVNNGWYDLAKGERVYCVEDPDYERSPRNLLGSTLGDWLKAAYPASRVFAASGKDRAAILTGGREADGAYWYDREEGTFTSSGYYPNCEPAWLEAFNRQRLAEEVFAQPWEPLPEASIAGEELGIERLERGLFPDPFPHVSGGLQVAPDDDFYASLYRSPFVDEALARLGEALIAGEGLGQDGYPDFLGLSFSAVDTVGHIWGPNSTEILDTLLRLDRALGELLDAVDRSIGLEHVLISLSADHGVAPVPEYQQLHGLPGRRIEADTLLCFQGAGRELARRFGNGEWVGEWGVFDEEVLAAAGATAAEADAELRRLLETCPGVARVWTRTELAAGGGEGDPYGEMYARTYHPERSAGILVQFDEDFMAYRARYDVTTHGSPYAYDTHVPWLLRLPDGRAGVVEERVATVDVAPTLATLAGIPVPGDRDGVDRSGLLPEGGSPDPGP